MPLSKTIHCPDLAVYFINVNALFQESLDMFHVSVTWLVECHRHRFVLFVFKRVIAKWIVDNLTVMQVLCLGKLCVWYVGKKGIICVNSSNGSLVCKGYRVEIVANLAILDRNVDVPMWRSWAVTTN